MESISNAGNYSSSTSSHKISAEELIVAIVVAGFGVACLFIFRVIQFRILQKNISKVATRTRMPLHAISRKQTKNIISSLITKRENLKSATIPSNPDDVLPPGLVGWSFPPSFENQQMSSIHFKTTISHMYEQFERCAVLRDPNLVRPKWMCVRDYVEAIAPTGRGATFASIYEEARFGKNQYSANQAKQAITHMAEIIAAEFPVESQQL